MLSVIPCKVEGPGGCPLLVRFPVMSGGGARDPHTSTVAEIFAYGNTCVTLLVFDASDLDQRGLKMRRSAQRSVGGWNDVPTHLGGQIPKNEILVR